MTSLFEATGVQKSFSGIRALEDVSLRVDAGERVGLIGPNGAGKTTFFNCVLGVLRPDAGRILLDGEDIGGLPVHRRARRGIGRTFQRIELFADMTVREHLLLADRVRRGEGSLLRDLFGRGVSDADERLRCGEVLELLGLGDLADEPVEALSLGQGRLVEVGRALMTEPRLLLADDEETDALAATLREVQRDRGFAVLLVEHDVELVASFTERTYVLDFGHLIAEGSTAEVMADEKVRQAYFGDVEGESGS